MSALVTFEHQMALADAFVESKLFGVSNRSQALSLMALCEAEGLHPAKAVQEYHIINGRPSLKADAMLGRFQRAGGSIRFTVLTDAKVEAVFSHPQGGTVTIDWTMERARQAGLATAMWSKYPRQMLRARVVSEGVRSIFPGVLGGAYTPEEVGEFEPASQVVDVTPNRTLVGVISPKPDITDVDESGAVDLCQALIDYANANDRDSINDLWSSIKGDHSKAMRVWDLLKNNHKAAFKVVNAAIKGAVDTAARGPKVDSDQQEVA